MIPLGLGTIMLLLVLFAMGAFRLCEPARKDDELDELDDGETSRREILSKSEIFRDGSHR